MKVLHIITCLDDGGAEAVLFRLIQNLPSDTHVVVSLSGTGKYGVLLKNLGVEVIAFNGDNWLQKIFSTIQLKKIIKLIQPDAIQTWMYQADLIGGIAARMGGVRNISWGLHNSAVTAETTPFHRLLIIRLNALLSRHIPKHIISVSKSGLIAHQKIGYDVGKLICIPNGHPIERFQPDSEARRAIRSEFGIDESETLLGIVARLDPQKDHLNLLSALAIVKGSASFKCFLVGNGLGKDTPLLSDIERHGLSKQVVLVGRRDDIPRIMNALDICISSSYAEAFPNVLCEAMACAVPCVTTDVGDSAFIVGDTGWVVPSRCPDLLAVAIAKAIENTPDSVRKAKARLRIVENFGINKMASAYTEVWSRVSK